MNRYYNIGDAEFDMVFENSLNGIPVSELTPLEIEDQEIWVNENWDDLVEGTY